jgi:hypothetical protein
MQRSPYSTVAFDGKYISSAGLLLKLVVDAQVAMNIDSVYRRLQLVIAMSW